MKESKVCSGYGQSPATNGFGRRTQLDFDVVSKTVQAPHQLLFRQVLAEVERAFRCLKGIDLLVRPIRHRTADRVPAHIFLCVLAYYVEWHLRQAWAPLLFEDEQRVEQRKHRDPVLPPQPSASVQSKKHSHQTADGLPVHSFDSLLKELAARARVTYALSSDKAEPTAKTTFRQLTPPTPLQARAFELIRMFPVAAK